MAAYGWRRGGGGGDASTKLEKNPEENHTWSLIKILQGYAKLDDRTKKNKYEQKFQSEWVSDPAFKGWLVAPKAGKNEASCKFCSKSFSCSKTSLNRHSELFQHKKAFSGAKNEIKLMTCFKKTRGKKCL